MFLVSLPIFLMAQPAEEEVSPRRKAMDNVEALKKGVLIVRLPSNAKKIKALSDLQNTPGLKPKVKSRVSRKLETTIAEGQSDNRTMVAIFREKYLFSELCFIYDTAVVQLKKGITDGYFLNDALEIDPGISIAGKNWFSLYIGYLDATQQSGAEAFILTDSSLNELPPPFPTAIRLDNLSYLINKALAPEIAVRKRMEKAVKKLQEKLKSFYEGG